MELNYTFLNFSPEAIIRLVQKLYCLLLKLTKQKATLKTLAFDLQNFVAT